MGRYLTGDHAFSYGYGEQPSNLVRLAGRSGAGQCFVEPRLALRFAADQIGPELANPSVVELARDAVRRTGVRPPSLLLLGDTHHAAIDAGADRAHGPADHAAGADELLARRA